MISVIGGGIAGLAAAYRLQQHGHDVHVFEAADEVGGLAGLYETAGDPIEMYYHHLSKSEETIVELADELGVADHLEWKIGKNAYYVDGTVHPLDKPWEILAYPHMSFYDKFRLTLLTQEIDIRGGRPRFDTYDDLAAFEDVPIGEFLLEHTTRGVYENFFEPLLDAKFGDRKDDVSAAWLLGRIKFRGERDLLRGEILGYFDGSFKVLLAALIDAVGEQNITTNARVTDLAYNETGVTSVTVETPTETAVHDSTAAIIAAMPNVLESLTGYTCAIDFQGAVCAVVTMDGPLTDTYWLNIADDAPFGALIEHTNFVSPDRYGGDHLLYIASYIQSYDEPLWQMTDSEVESVWLSHIETLFPQFDQTSVQSVQIARNPRAAPVYERGYRELIVPYDLGEDIAPGVYYAGMASHAQYPERSLNGGIVAGFECADRIAERNREPGQSGTDPFVTPTLVSEE
ncbi:NAD(P)/FAD-dependent oxidoreductase [Halorubraceae archaeon YAN]|nr:NAD(P)/FAD-dependent oxidoreductase [Halorubraceae archaeon YAN]